MSEETTQTIEEKLAETIVENPQTGEKTKELGNDEEGKVVGAPVEEEKKAEEGDTSRPEWLPEKFKTAEDFSKSYSELEKTLKEKGKLAPEEYTLQEKDYKLDTEQDSFKAFKDWAKEKKVSNDMFNDILDFAVQTGVLLPADAFDKEREKLGKEADAILNTISSWSEKRLSETERDTLGSMVFTAEQAKLMNKLIRMSDGKNVPTDVSGAGGEGLGDMQRKLNELLSNPKIRTDFDLKTQAEELAERIAKAK